MVAGNRYSEFATTTSASGSSHNQTQVRAEPGVGGAGQMAPGSLGSVLTGRSFLSRPSGPQSLACEDAVLAKPAAPVASAAFAHTDDLLSSLFALLPPASGPARTMERRVTATVWYRTPEHPARVEGWTYFLLPLSSTLVSTQGRGSPLKYTRPGKNEDSCPAWPFPVICLCYRRRGQGAGTLLLG